MTSLVLCLHLPKLIPNAVTLAAGDDSSLYLAFISQTLVLFLQVGSVLNDIRGYIAITLVDINS